MSLLLVALLVGLVFPLAGAAARPPFNRAEWGSWIDEDRDCQDTRQEVLIRESRVPVLFRDGEAQYCTVAWGEWVSLYDGETANDPMKFQIDHMLSLKEAHEAGGWAWPREKKRAFLNWQPNLVAVSVRSNASKGARGLAEWRPEKPEAGCRLGQGRAGARVAWRLARPSVAEAEATKELLETCTP